MGRSGAPRPAATANAGRAIDSARRRKLAQPPPVSRIGAVVYPSRHATHARFDFPERSRPRAGGGNALCRARRLPPERSPRGPGIHPQAAGRRRPEGVDRAAAGAAGRAAGRPGGHYLYGRALGATEPSLAVWALRKAMDDPEWLVPAGSQLAFWALASEDFNEVVKVTSRILEKDPENVRALLMRGNAYAHSRRNYDLALADAKRVFEIDRDAAEAYEPMILALLGLGKMKEAREALDEAGRRITELGLKKEIAAWHCVTTAIFQNESGELEQAKQTWSRCLETYPTDPDVVISAQRFYDTQGEPERSFEIVQTAFKAAPNS